MRRHILSTTGAIQDYYDSSPASRAAVFFAALGCTCAQLSINVLLNSVSTGMDMAGLWPRYINIRRGAYILATVSPSGYLRRFITDPRQFGLASNPWQIVSSAATFLNVISGLGVFIAPMTGIMLADYLVIRRCKVKVEDLYNGTPSSIYWYHNGFHWRAIVAFILGAWPFCPGFIITLVHPGSTSNWVKLFNISFLVGLSIGFLSFLAICTASPPPYEDQGLNYLDDERFCKSVRGDIVQEKENHVATPPLDEKLMDMPVTRVLSA
jgi:NCS1 family nucleobase:cation symporter-1